MRRPIRLLTFIGVLASAMFGPAPALATVASIDLPAAVVVNEPSVLLGQIARLTSTDLTLVRRLTALPLGSMPATSDGVLLDRASLARWVRSQTGLRDDQIEWNGEAATRITVAANRISSKALLETAQSALAQWLVSRSERFEVRPVSGVSDIVIAGGPVRLVAKPLHYDRPVHRMQVWVDLLGATGVVRSVPVSFEVTAYAKAAVAQRDAAIGSTVASVLTEREVEVTALSAAPRSSRDIVAQGASTLRLRRGLRAGDVVTAFDLEPVPAVQRGDWVTLRLVNGSVSMESRVEALQDAQVGQSVRVKLTGAERSVLARVTGTGLVEIAR